MIDKSIISERSLLPESIGAWASIAYESNCELDYYVNIATI